MSAAPVTYIWTGEAMAPAGPGFARMCDRQFTVGERYRLEQCSERSEASHRHYFASLHDAWLNLPEDLSERFQTSEHLRKFALCKCGYADQRQIVCASKAEAQRVAAFIKPMDEYAIVTASEAVVTVYTAKSQSMRAMGKAEFQKSKDDVLNYVASLIGTTPGTLAQNAGKAA